MLGVTYKTAWFMAHRIRYAMAQLNLPMMSGTVESGRNVHRWQRARITGREKNKAAVVSLVERGGNVRSFHTEMVTGKTLKQVISENVASNAHVMTDDHPGYRGLRKDFRRHSTIPPLLEGLRSQRGDVLN